MHVDDGLAGSTSMNFLSFIKGEIKKAFGIKDPCPCTLACSLRGFSISSPELASHIQVS
jgi:hypothetical protein